MNAYNVIYVRNDMHLLEFIANGQFKDRKTYFQFKCKICGCLTTKQFRKNRLIRLLCTKHSTEHCCLQKFGAANPFSSKDIQKKTHNTIHKHSIERHKEIDVQKEIERQRKQNIKIQKIIDKFGSVENYNTYNSLLTRAEKRRFREILNYGSHENAQKIKVQHTRKSNIEKYGVEWVSQTEHCKNTTIQTNRKKYGVDWYYQSDEFKLKSCDTKLRLHGDAHYRNDEQIYQTCLDRYGSISPFGNEEIRNTINQTNIKNFGVDNPWKVKEIQDKCKQKYLFENQYFDSAPEIAFYIWLKDNNIDFEYSPNIFFEYECDQKIWRYYPDFKVQNRFYEIKGDQFFEDKDPTKRMINPYDASQNDRYEAKHQCMLKNDVKILTSKDYVKYVHYVDEKYGCNYLKSFKCKIKERISM